MNIVKAGAAALAVAMLAIPAHAQNVNANNLVNVNVSNVANNLAQDLDVNVSQIPVTVQVPVGVAANVCGVAANVLATDNTSGAPSCDATTTSQALTRAVSDQLLQQ